VNLKKIQIVINKLNIVFCGFWQPCKLFMQPADVKFMFSEMMQRSEQIYFG